MYLYELFSHPDRFSYRAHIISNTTCVLIFSTALTLLSPFLLTYYTGDFWLTESVYSEQPRLNNITKYILLADNSVSNKFFMSSYSILNTNFQTNLITGSKFESVSDIDGDGLIDQFRTSFDINIGSTETFRSINIWLILQWELRKKQRINMETMALINIVPPSTLAAGVNNNITVYGQLIFEQKYPIENAGNDSTYNKSIINIDNSLTTIPDLDSILDEYFTRKYYTSYQSQYIWYTPGAASTSTDKPITINVVVNVGRQAIRYVPGFWQAFKWGWIQYVCVFLPFMIVFNRLKLFVFTNNLVRTLAPLATNHRHKA